MKVKSDTYFRIRLVKAPLTYILKQSSNVVSKFSLAKATLHWKADELPILGTINFR